MHSLHAYIYVVLSSVFNQLNIEWIIFKTAFRIIVSPSSMVSEQYTIASFLLYSELHLSLISNGFSRLCTCNSFTVTTEEGWNNLLGSAIDDPMSPFFLHRSDWLNIVSQTLTRENYASWTRAMIIALSVGFVGGSIARPDDVDLNLLTSWI